MKESNPPHKRKTYSGLGRKMVESGEHHQIVRGIQVNKLIAFQTNFAQDIHVF